ncbi:MAG: VTC domain-containing protein [Verrucomicrobiaceae bacterium]|nr:VTC domain-containing protein [Verrucomicrobiaceae bacterium]
MASETKTSEKPNHFRYERKFTTRWPYQNTIALIRRNAAQFREIYAERHINNIYFDDLDFANYFANDDGIRNRLKTRIRWYGDLSGAIKRPALEIKVKRGWAGEKPTFKLAPFTLGPNFSSLDAQALFRRSDLPGWIHQRVIMESPMIINRYARRYFLSADGHCRLTIDRDLRFFRCPFPGDFVPRFHEPRETLIIEMKYSCDGDLGIDIFSNDFRFRMTKFSKYATGVNLLYR